MVCGAHSTKLDSRPFGKQGGQETGDSGQDQNIKHQKANIKDIRRGGQNAKRGSLDSRLRGNDKGSTKIKPQKSKISAAAEMKMFSSPSWLAMRIRPQLRFDWVISHTREAISTGVLFVEVPDGF